MIDRGILSWDRWWGGRGEGLNWIECDGLALRKLFEPSFSFHNTRGGTKVRRRNRCKHERRCSCCLRGFWWLLSITMIRNLRWESSRDEDLARAKKKNHFFLAKIMTISKIWKVFFKEKLAIIDVHTVRWWRLCLLPSWRPPPVLEGQWSLQTALLCWDSCTILEDWALGAISFRHCLWKV